MKKEHLNKERVELLIRACQELGHVQQVAFSTYHNSLTQVCFRCKKVRTSIKIEDLE